MTMPRYLSSAVLLGLFTIGNAEEPATNQSQVPTVNQNKAEVLDPLDLVTVLKLAASTTNVDVARLERSIAEAEVGAERMALLPRVDAVGTLQRGNDIPRYVGDKEGAATTYEGRVRLGQAILDLSAWYRTDAAKRQLEAEEAALSLAADQAMVVSAGGLLDLLSAEALIAVRQEDLILAEDLARQAQAQVDLGASDPISVTRAASQVQAARSALLTAEGRQQRASIELARLLDLPPRTDIRAADHLHSGLVPESALLATPSVAEEFALKNRSEMQVSVATLAALDAAVAAARGAGLPRLEAFGDVGYGGVHDTDDGAGWNVGLSLTIPLVSDVWYRTDQARFRRQQQKVRQQQVETRIRAQVRSTMTTITTAEARLQADATRRELAQQELEQAEARFAEGLEGNLAVVQAQRSRSVAELAYIQSLSALLRSRIQFIAALGSIQGLVADSADTNEG